MTFGEKLLDSTIEYVQATETRSGAWESMTAAGQYAGREPRDIAAEEERIIMELVSANKVEG